MRRRFVKAVFRPSDMGYLPHSNLKAKRIALSGVKWSISVVHLWRFINFLSYVRTMHIRMQERFVSGIFSCVLRRMRACMRMALAFVCIFKIIISLGIKYQLGRRTNFSHVRMSCNFLHISVSLQTFVMNLIIIVIVSYFLISLLKNVFQCSNIMHGQIFR